MLLFAQVPWGVRSGGEDRVMRLRCLVAFHKEVNNDNTNNMRLGGPQSRFGRYGEVKILDLTGTRTPAPHSSSP
jgi:hypothetical protein